MYQFIETIKLENGQFFLAEYHKQRVKATFQTHFPKMKPFDPVNVLCEQDFPKTGLYKCRIEYSQVPILIEFVPYVPRRIRSLKMVEMPIAATHFKFLERTAYKSAFAQRGDCDEVLLLRDGLVTDCSYANVAFFDGIDWITPSEPTLFGTQRAYLLDKGKLKVGDIKASEISQFSHIRIFNSMIEFGEIAFSTKFIQE